MYNGIKITELLQDKMSEWVSTHFSCTWKVSALADNFDFCLNAFFFYA